MFKSDREMIIEVLEYLKMKELNYNDLCELIEFLRERGLGNRVSINKINEVITYYGYKIIKLDSMEYTVIKLK